MGPTSTGQDETAAGVPAVPPGSDPSQGAAQQTPPEAPSGEHPGMSQEPVAGGADSPARSRRGASAPPQFRPPPPRLTPPTDTMSRPLDDSPDGLSDPLGPSETDADNPASGSDTEAGEPIQSSRNARRRRTSGSNGDFPAKSGGISGVTGWKVATAFLTAIAVLAVGWGVYQTTKLARTEAAVKSAGASASSQIQSLDARVAAMESSNAQASSDLTQLQQEFSDFTGAVAQGQKDAQAEYKKVTDSLSVAPAQYKAALGQTSALSTAYLTAKASADSAPSDQEAQIKALEAKSALLANCASIVVGATQQIYAADKPTETMTTVAKDLATVAPSCKVVTSG